MNTETRIERGRYDRFWEQLAEVRRQHAPLSLRVEPATATEGSLVPPRYVYESERMLLCAPDAARAEQLGARVCRQRPERFANPQPVSEGVVKVDIDPEAHVPTEVDWVNTMLESDYELGADRRAGRLGASPNHVVSIAHP